MQKVFLNVRVSHIFPSLYCLHSFLQNLHFSHFAVQVW